MSAGSAGFVPKRRINRWLRREQRDHRTAGIANRQEPGLSFTRDDPMGQAYAKCRFQPVTRECALTNIYCCDMPAAEATSLRGLSQFDDIRNDKDIDDEELENELDKSQCLLAFGGSSALSEWHTYFCRLSVGDADQWLYYHDAKYEADEIILIGVGAHTNEAAIAMFLRLVIEQNMAMPGSINLEEGFAVSKLDLLSGWRGAGLYADDHERFAEDFEGCLFS